MSEFNFSLMQTPAALPYTNKFKSKLQTIFYFSDYDNAKIDITNYFRTKFPLKVKNLC